MSFLKEFKQFAMRGNLVDMAVAFVIGGAFGRVVSSFISGVVMPPLGKLMGNVDFKDLKYVIQQGTPEVKDAGGVVVTAPLQEVAIHYGEFITATIDFIIVAFVMFLVVKGMNAVRKKEVEAPAEPSNQEKLLTEIRDLLKK